MRLESFAEIYEQMADLPAAPPDCTAQAGAEEFDAAIRQNLEVLGYGE